MVTCASNADVAVLLVDASKGLLAQDKRHSRIISMFGIEHVVLAINKMDLTGWNETAFNAILSEFQNLVAEFGFKTVQAIPMSALSGDNLTFRCNEAAWYTGPTLLDYLETVDVSRPETSQPFRLPVQYVNQPDSECRSYCGHVASGHIGAGDSIRILPGGVEAKVKSIVATEGGQGDANAGDAVTITFDREVDISRGQVISGVDDPVEISDQFEASVLSLSAHHLVSGRPYLLKLHTAQVGVSITDIKYKLDINQGSHLAANTLGLNDIGEVTLYTDQPVAFAPYHQCKALGAFILVDSLTNETVGAGIIKYALRRASNIHWQAVDVNKAARAKLKMQQPACIWLTGLSGSGKSTIANLLEKRMHSEGRHTYLLDGDNVRHGLNRDLGFTEADRVENIRRVSEAAKLLVDAGLIVIVSFISPFRAERDFARSLFAPEEFYEVFVDTPLEECEKRDVKGLYAKARQGKIANFTGIDSPYEKPSSPEVTLDTVSLKPEECVSRVVATLHSRGERQL